MRLARTTSKAGSPLGRLPVAGAQAARERVAPGVGRGRLDGDRVGVHAERRRGAELERGDGQDPRAAADVEDARVGRGRRGRPPPRAAARHSRVVGWSPVPNAIPGSSARTTSSGRASVASPGRPDDEPPADAHDREVRLPGVGPVGLVDEPRPQLADRPQPERLEMAERRRRPRPPRGPRRPGREPGGRRGRWPAGSDRAGRPDPRRPARTRARPTSRPAPPGRGSR